MRVALLTVLYPLLAFTSFIDPYFGVLNYTFVSVVRPEQLTYGVTAVSGVFAYAIVCLALSCLMRGENLLGAVKERFFVYFFLYVAACYLATLTGSYTVFGVERGSFYYLNQLPQILCFCLCLYAVLTRLTPEKFEQYLAVLAGLVCFMGLWGIDQHFRGNIQVEKLFGYDRCAVTSVFVLYLPLSFYYLKKPGARPKAFGLLLLAVFATMIVFTESRAGLLGLGVVLLGLFWHSRRKAAFLAWSLCFVLFVLAIMPETQMERFETMQTTSVEEGEITDFSSASRLLMWKLSLKMIPDHPLLGIGFLNFDKANKEYGAAFKGIIDDRLYTGTFGGPNNPGLSHTHNTYLNLLVEGGVLATLPFCLLVLLPFKRGRKVNKSWRGAPSERLELVNLINVGVAGFLVTAIFDSLMLVDFFYWNLTIAYFLIRELEGARLAQEACPAHARHGEDTTPVHGLDGRHWSPAGFGEAGALEKKGS